MHRRMITPIYMLNTVFQSFFSLMTPIGLMLLLAWALHRYAGVGKWIYVVLILVGVLSGLFSMVSFVLKSMRALETLERQNEEKYGAPSREGQIKAERCAGDKISSNGDDICDEK